MKKIVVLSHEELEKFINEWLGWRDGWEFSDDVSFGASVKPDGSIRIPPGTYTFTQACTLQRGDKRVPLLPILKAFLEGRNDRLP